MNYHSILVQMALRPGSSSKEVDGLYLNSKFVNCSYRKKKKKINFCQV